MLERKIIDLGINAATGTALTTYNLRADEVNDAFRAELNEMIGTKELFRKNKLDVYTLIEEVADVVVPKRVLETMGTFIDSKTFKHNEKPVFRRRLGRQRAKSTFVTKAARAGVYETFRLDTEEIEIPTLVHGGAARISLQDVLTGDVNMAEVMDIILEGLVDAVYNEVQMALLASYNNTKRPTNTKVSVSAYDHQALVNLINTIEAYGPSVVMTTKTFGGYMRPTAGAVATFNPNVSLDDLKDLRETGLIQIVNGAPVIALPQSFTDETHAATVINPRVAYVFPSGGAASEKVVKLAFEGGTLVSEYVNTDDSMDIKAHRKFGIGLLNNNSWGIYENKAIVDTGWAKLT